jgi:23S rRNA (guanosine2251-2'-O)-methyltransferase
MKTNQNAYIRQCIRPGCRFRFQSSQADYLTKCPKCGSPTHSEPIPHYFTCKQSDPEQIAKSKIEIVLDNIRSAYNVGSILRTANGIGAYHIHFCGITPTPGHLKIQKTSLGTEFQIPWTQQWNALDPVNEAKRNGTQIFALETQNGSVSIFQLTKELLRFPLMLVLGNELSGIDPEILKICDFILEIPMFGEKNSLNVAVAFGIAAYFIRKVGLDSGVDL